MTDKNIHFNYCLFAFKVAKQNNELAVQLKVLQLDYRYLLIFFSIIAIKLLLFLEFSFPMFFGKMFKQNQYLLLKIIVLALSKYDKIGKHFIDGPLVRKNAKCKKIYSFCFL